jgi:hypothetical protein
VDILDRLSRHWPIATGSRASSAGGTGRQSTRPRPPWTYIPRMPGPGSGSAWRRSSSGDRTSDPGAEGDHPAWGSDLRLPRRTRPHLRHQRREALRLLRDLETRSKTHYVPHGQASGRMPRGGRVALPPRLTSTRMPDRAPISGEEATLPGGPSPATTLTDSALIAILSGTGRCIWQAGPSAISGTDGASTRGGTRSGPAGGGIPFAGVRSGSRETGCL